MMYNKSGQFICLFIAVLWIVVVCPAIAQEDLEPLFTDEDCTGCHEASGDDSSPGVDLRVYKASVHGKADLGCLDCHSSHYQKYPHEGGKSSDCFDCHDKTEEEFARIVNAQDKSDHSSMLDCTDCHDPHGMKKAVEQTVLEKDAGCLECHKGEEGQGIPSLAKDHDWHPQAALHLGRMSCIACHTIPDPKMPGFSHRIVPKTQASKNCHDCHSLNGRMIHYITRIDAKDQIEKDHKKLIEDFYIVGSTRIQSIDCGGIALIGLTLLGILIHGLLRLILRKRGQA